MSEELKTPEGMIRVYAVPLAIIWASLAVGIGYNTWKAHEAFYEAKRMSDRIQMLDNQWDKTEMRANRRIDNQKRYIDARFKALENPDRAK